MRNRILYMLFFFSSISSYCQLNIDSLKKIGFDPSLHDTIQLEALHQISWTNGFKYINSDSAFFYAQILYDRAVALDIPEFKGKAENTMGLLYSDKGMPDSAIVVMKRSYRTFEEMNEKRGMALTNMSLGAFFRGIGEYDSALVYYDRSMVISEAINDQQSTLKCLNKLGNLFRNQSEYLKAIHCFQQSMEIARLTNDSWNEAVAMSNLGSVYYSLADFDKALFYFQKSYEMIKTNDSETRSMISAWPVNIGVVYSAKNNPSEAIRYYNIALEIEKEIGNLKAMSTIYGNMGVVYYEEHNFEKAREFYKMSLDIEESRQDLYSLAIASLNYGAVAFDFGDTAEALYYSSQSFRIGTDLHTPQITNLALVLLIKVNLATKKFELAQELALNFLENTHKFLFLNFPILSEKEKEFFFSSLSIDYDRFYSYVLKQNKFKPELSGTAFNTVLQNKGILLRSSTAMRISIQDSGNDSLISVYDDWIKLKKKIAKGFTNGTDIIELEKEANELEKFLVQYSSDFDQMQKHQSVVWQDVKSSLKPGEAAIEFIHFKHTTFEPKDTFENVFYCALLVKHNSEFPVMIQLFEEKKLIEILGEFQGNNLNYINSIYGKRNKKNVALYDLIWRPMEVELSGVKKVFVSPTGLLHRISFAALNKQQDVYLCDNYTIQMIASSSKIVLPADFSIDDQTTATIFGGIDYSSDSTEREIWNYLEGTKIESEKIQQILNKNKIDVSYFSSHDATEEQFKKLASTSKILHIATHGFFYPDPKESLVLMETEASENVQLAFRGRGFGYANFVENQNPLMRSGLVFAGANDVWSTQNPDGEDGVLTAQEVAHIDMRNTQLVVLSACETGLGDIKGSEGVYGLQRAFKMAGVQFIIMSLWQVPDKETAEFMTLFYKRLIKLKDIHLAFNQTQKAMRAKYDPYYWAAFVLIE